MTNRDNDLRDRLQRLTGDPAPTAGQETTARQSLHAVIAAETQVRKPRSRRRVMGLAAAVLAVLIGVGVFTLIAVPSRVDATLVDLARATRELSPEDLPPGAYIYVHTDRLVLADFEVDPDFPAIFYLLPTSEDAWWQRTTVVVQTTVGEPIFFDPIAEQLYYQAGLNEADRVGETFEEQMAGVTGQLNLSQWPTDPDLLQAAMKDFVARTGSDMPTSVGILQLARRLLAPELQPPPALRAAVLEVLATLGLDSTLRDDGVSTSITYGDVIGTVTETLIFDPAGYLTEATLTVRDGAPEIGIPPGTAYDRIKQTAPQAVADVRLVPPS